MSIEPLQLIPQKICATFNVMKGIRRKAKSVVSYCPCLWAEPVPLHSPQTLIIAGHVRNSTRIHYSLSSPYRLYHVHNHICSLFCNQMKHNFESLGCAILY